MKSTVSIVIPVKENNDRFRQEIIPALKKQTFKNFELIIAPDQEEKKENFPLFVKIVSSWPITGPAAKRDLGVKKAKGDLIAFIDDDVYPDKNWLKNAVRCLQSPQIAAVCGPGITPPSDNLKQKVSGWVWRSWLGAGGAGTYRCRPEEKRAIDDYPTFNLIVRKKDFQAVGGFDSHFWPGEDTKLCHDLVYKLGKKIIYDPKILVYHHRREIFLPHLRQISRFAIHRGHFARILPKTSFRIGYFIPTFFTAGLISGFFLSSINPLFKTFYLVIIGMYLTVLLLTALQVFLKEKNLQLAFLLIPSIFLTHLVYGALFIKGLLAKKLEQ